MMRINYNIINIQINAVISGKIRRNEDTIKKCGGKDCSIKFTVNCIAAKRTYPNPNR